MDELAVALALLASSIVIGLFLVTLPVSGGTIWRSQQRAKELFLSRLNDAERRRWAREQRLIVVGSSGRPYTLAPYESFNIRSGNESYCLCVLGRLPSYDKLLAQRLLIEADEKAFLAIANRREI